MDIIYEVYSNSSGTLDVYEYNNLEDAIKAATDISMSENDVDVLIDEIHRETIKTFRNGGEIE